MLTSQLGAGVTKPIECWCNQVVTKSNGSWHYAGITKSTGCFTIMS